jgi:hypothetical protein
MNLLVLHESGEYTKRYSETLPNLGNKVDIFVTPPPTVVDVILWPNEETKAKFGAIADDVEALVLVQ